MTEGENVTETPYRNKLVEEGTAQARSLLQKMRGDLAWQYLGEIDREKAMEFKRALGVLITEAKTYLNNFSAFLPEVEETEDPDMSGFMELRMEFIKLRAGGLSIQGTADKLGLTKGAAIKWNELLQNAITNYLKGGNA